MAASMRSFLFRLWRRPVSCLSDIKGNFQTSCNFKEPLHLSRSVPYIHRLVAERSIYQGKHLQEVSFLVQLCQRRLGLAYSTSSQNANTVQPKNNQEEDKLYKWIELKVKSHDDAVLESYGKYVTMAANELGVTVDSIAKPFRTIRRLTLLKSRHIYKKHRVQYEMRTYFRIIKLKHLTGSMADVFLEYIERNLPEGVAMQVKKCSLERLPRQLQSPPEQLEDELTSSSSSDEEGSLRKEP